MRGWPLLLLVLVAAPAAGTLTPGLNADGLDVSGAFGAPGLPLWETHEPPPGLASASNAGEPTIGIPWNTDSVFYRARSATYKITFGDGLPAEATWRDVTPIYYVTDVDPMLHADPDTGRVWTGGLDGPCSLMTYSDDDGQTWVPTGNMCTGAQFDHQSIGSGPWKDPAKALLYPHVVHYCGQLAVTACTTSPDGGVTWQPWTFVGGACGGMHGHIRVSPATGTAVVPHKRCGDQIGFALTENDGLTWSSRTHPAAPASDGFDPSAQFTRGSGWLYLGQADSRGAFLGLSKDEGRTWEPIGTSGGKGASWLDVGAFHDPPIVKATFADVQAGDDDRVAFSFLGLVDLDGDGKGAEYPGIHQCDTKQELMVWHYYVAMSHDAGASWTVQRATEDPVQVGGVWLGQGGTCRNLLDFNDMDIDSTGRVSVGYSDGCTGECDRDPSPSSGGYRSTAVRLLRQATGRGLFSAHDLPTPPAPPSPDPTSAPPPTSSAAVAHLRITGLGNGTRVDAGPLQVQGTVTGDAEPGTGRVVVHGPGGKLGSTRADARPTGVSWQVPVDLSGAEGPVTLRAVYAEDGVTQAEDERRVIVVAEGEGRPAEAQPKLEVVASPDDRVRVRLSVVGEAGDAPWRLEADGTVLRQGTADALPLETDLSGLHGSVLLRLVFGKAPLERFDEEQVVFPAAQDTPPPGAVWALLASLLLAARRRRP